MQIACHTGVLRKTYILNQSSRRWWLQYADLIAVAYLQHVLSEVIIDDCDADIISDVHVHVFQASDGFTFAISCDRGKILYTSESCRHILNYKQVKSGTRKYI